MSKYQVTTEDGSVYEVETDEASRPTPADVKTHFKDYAPAQDPKWKTQPFTEIAGGFNDTVKGAASLAPKNWKEAAVDAVLSPLARPAAAMIGAHVGQAKKAWETTKKPFTAGNAATYLGHSLAAITPGGPFAADIGETAAENPARAAGMAGAGAAMLKAPKAVAPVANAARTVSRAPAALANMATSPGMPAMLGGAGEMVAGAAGLTSGHPIGMVAGAGIGMRGMGRFAKGRAERRAAQQPPPRQTATPPPIQGSNAPPLPPTRTQVAPPPVQGANAPTLPPPRQQVAPPPLRNNPQPPPEPQGPPAYRSAGPTRGPKLPVKWPDKAKPDKAAAAEAPVEAGPPPPAATAPPAGPPQPRGQQAASDLAESLGGQPGKPHVIPSPPESPIGKMHEASARIDKAREAASIMSEAKIPAPQFRKLPDAEKAAAWQMIEQKLGKKFSPESREQAVVELERLSKNGMAKGGVIAPAARVRGMAHRWGPKGR